MKVDAMVNAAPLDRIARLARDAEDAGFSGLVITESGRTAYLSCVAAATAAPGLDIATGVAVAFPRSPMVTASVAWELAELTERTARVDHRGHDAGRRDVPRLPDHDRASGGQRRGGHVAELTREERLAETPRQRHADRARLDHAAGVDLEAERHFT